MLLLPEESRKDSQAAIGECYCTELFRIEKALADLSPKERYKQRLEQANPVLDAMLVWANDLYGKTAGKSAFGKALYYLIEQWPHLVKYLEDGRLELSNNRAGQQRNLQPDRDCKGKELGSVSISVVGSADSAQIEPER